MRKFFLLGGAFLLLLPLTAVAQEEFPKAEAFGGYSFMRTNIEPGMDQTGAGFFPLREFNMHGWAGSVAGNMNRWFGFVGDFSGHYDESGSGVSKIDTNIHSFLFGPRFSYRSSSRFTPFGHALFGAARGEFDAEGSGNSLDNTKFAMAWGGGFDLKLGEATSIRLIQADYLMTRFGRDDNQHNIRLSTGLVFTWR